MNETSEQVVPAEAVQGLPAQQVYKQATCLNLFWTFFRVGLFTFGGGFAMATVIRHELVGKRRWLSEDEFIDIMSTATIVPGAIAVNLAFLQGQKFRGFRGALSAVAGTILPPLLIILAVVWFALPYFDRPAVAAFLKGCAVVIAGQIAFAAFMFARRLRGGWQGFLACLGGLAVLIVGLHPIWAIVVAAAMGYLLRRKNHVAAAEAENP